jgi:hypothetical protein
VRFSSPASTTICLFHLSDGARKALAEIGDRLGKPALQEVTTIVKPDTILGWHRKLVAQKFDGSPQRQSPGRPNIDPALEGLIVRIAQDNRSWGYNRIVGAGLHLNGSSTMPVSSAWFYHLDRPI